MVCFDCIGLVALVWSCFLVGLWFGVSVSRVSGGDLVVLIVLLLV